MVERRMRQSIYAVASFWLTAWVNAGQPDLSGLAGRPMAEADREEMKALNLAWQNGKRMIGRDEENKTGTRHALIYFIHLLPKTNT